MDEAGDANGVLLTVIIPHDGMPEKAKFLQVSMKLHSSGKAEFFANLLLPFSIFIDAKYNILGSVECDLMSLPQNTVLSINVFITIPHAMLQCHQESYCPFLQSGKEIPTNQ